MTIIALRDGIMASDTNTICGGVITPRSKKIFLKNELLIGVSGNYTAGVMYAEQFCLSRSDATYCRSEDAFQVLIWNGTSAWEDDENYYDIELPKAPFYAIGSGAAVALGAMHQGATAVEAAKIACLVDTNCGGRIQTMELV